MMITSNFGQNSMKNLEMGANVWLKLYKRLLQLPYYMVCEKMMTMMGKMWACLPCSKKWYIRTDLRLER